MSGRGLRPVRACASLALMAALLWPAAGSADHDRIPYPAPRSTAARLPAGLRLDRGAVTVSGLSSGASSRTSSTWPIPRWSPGPAS
jgi:hypothetical protein